MLNSLPVRSLWRSLNRLTRVAIEFAAVMAVLISLSIIALRYILLPSIEQYHSVISASLSKAIGHPVTIGRIEGDWQGFQPHLGLTDVRILNGEQKPALVLQKIDISVSWMTLLAADVRLSNLDIVKPELLIRRDAQGEIFLGDLSISGASGDYTMADWLLNQSRIIVRDALIVWLDEQRDAPPLVLQKVNLRIESLFGRHQFAMRALPQSELSTPLDVRADFNGASFGDMSAWRGQLFTKLDYTDVTDWRPWLDFPSELKQGRGALRGWIGIENGKLSSVVADLDLRDVATRLGEDIPDLVVLNMRGRAAWSRVPGGHEISTRKLAMQLQNGLKFKPTDFLFRTEKHVQGQSTVNQVSTNLLQLEDVVSLAKFLPIEAGMRERLDALAPRGRLSNLNASWENSGEKLDRFTINGQFDNIALHQVGSMPGFSGLTADIDGSETSGRLNITSHQLHIDTPGIMREPLFFSILTGQAGWRNDGGQLKVNVDNVTVANDDLAGNLYGSYHTVPGTKGVLDLTARLTRGDIRRAARYTPLIALHQEGNDWLNGALLAGHTNDFRIRIKGNLSDFPIKQETNDVLLKIGGHVQGGVLEFAKDWPRIENINGEFLIRGNKMEIIVPTANMAQTRLRNVVVTIPEMAGNEQALEVNGEAVGDNDTFLQFIQHSPVRGYINGFTDGVRASGNGHLALFLHIPLGSENDKSSEVKFRGENTDQSAEVEILSLTGTGEGKIENAVSGDNQVKVSGNFNVQGSDIDLGEGIPWLRNASGVLTFTESGMQASGVSARILGGAAKIDVKTSEDGGVHATVKGSSNIDYWRKNNPHPLLRYFSGGAAWDADIRLVNKNAQIIINSDLQGMGSTLPQPFSKRAGSALPLRVEKAIVADGQDLITASLGDLLQVSLERSEAKGIMEIRRGLLNFGIQEQRVDNTRKRKRPRKKDGVWITGNLPVVSVEGWGDAFSSPKKSRTTIPLGGVNLTIGNLIGFGKTAGAVKVEGAQRGDGIDVQLNGNALSGEAAWLPHGFEKGGKLSLRLRNMQLDDDKQTGKASPAVNPDQAKISPSDIPALEIAVERLQLKGNPVGRFDLVGHPEGKDWRLRRLNITNPDGSLSGDGVWLTEPRGTQTQVNLQLAINDAGNTLARYGYPDAVKGGSGKLSASLTWDGTPAQFNYAALDGTLNLDTGKGRFLQMEPGAGKLLSILSLQALPKHISLDFTDVFSAGFQFDSIKGNANISKGVIDTQDFKINGSAAKVTMKGNVDLNTETQNLRVRVLPTIGDSVSLLGAFAAGPAVGVGALIVNKVLGDPLDKLVSFEYNVDGSWSNPNVVKISRPPAKLPE